MTDIISKDRKRASRDRDLVADQPSVGVPGSLDPREITVTDHPELLALVEMLFFAYRDFTGEADAVLTTYDLGRAHHRVLHFVNRRPGIRVADLLELLKITKQSLGRVLRKLVADGWIEQAPGGSDRRERLLTLTPAGQTLAAKLAALQTSRIDKALRASENAGTNNVHDSVREFLSAMIARIEQEPDFTAVGGLAPKI